MTDIVVNVIAATERLRLRCMTEHDAAFMLELLNEPGWLRYIGNRGVHNEDDAREYLRERIQQPLQRCGYGMYGMESQSDGALVGLAGLVKRDYLRGPDLGFALLDRYTGQGLAFEAATAVLAHAQLLKLPRVLAITVPTNDRSIRLLQRLGFARDGEVQAPGVTTVLQCYARDSNGVAGHHL